MIELGGTPDAAFPLNPTSWFNRNLVSRYKVLPHNLPQCGALWRDSNRRYRNDLTPTNWAKEAASTGFKGFPTPGGMGGSCSMDGADDYLTVSSAQGLPAGAANLFLSCWVFLRSTAANCGLVSVGQNGTNNSRRRLTYSTGLGFSASSTNNAGSSASATFNASTTWITGRWVHVAGTWTGGASRKLYLNGELVTTETTNLTLNDPDQIRVGADHATAAGPLNGLIDDICINNLYMTDQMVRQFYIDSLNGSRADWNWIHRAPLVRAAGNVVVTPGTLALSLTGFAPTILTPVVATPPVKALTLTPFAPSVLTPVVATPPVSALSLTPYAPSVLTPVVVTPPGTALTLTPFAPTILTPVVCTPPTTALVLTSYAPDVVVAPPAGTTYLYCMSVDLLPYYDGEVSLLPYYDANVTLEDC